MHGSRYINNYIAIYAIQSNAMVFTLSVCLFVSIYVMSVFAISWGLESRTAILFHSSIYTSTIGIVILNQQNKQTASI